jgi:hypothetical protein
LLLLVGGSTTLLKKEANKFIKPQLSNGFSFTDLVISFCFWGGAVGSKGGGEDG